MDSTPEENLELSKAYAAEYKKLRRLLRRDVRPGKERDDVMQDLHTLLLAAQREQKLPESIYGGSFSDFYDELIDAMASTYTQKERGIRLLLRCSAYLAAGLVVLSIALGLYYWNSGAFGVWSQGMSYLTEAEGYAMSETVVEGDYAVSLDLEHLGANTGKTIYEDSACAIAVADVQRQPDGNFVIYFCARGSYDRQGGELVSAISTVSVPGHLGFRPTGALTAEVGSQTFNGALFAISETKKDGNEFAFYLFDPQQLGEGTAAIEQNNGEVTVRLHDLTRTVWSLLP